MSSSSSANTDPDTVAAIRAALKSALVHAMKEQEEAAKDGRKANTPEVAARHGIPVSTLFYWLSRIKRGFSVLEDINNYTPDEATIYRYRQSHSPRGSENQGANTRDYDYGSEDNGDYRTTNDDWDFGNFDYVEAAKKAKDAKDAKEAGLDGEEDENKPSPTNPIRLERIPRLEAQLARAWWVVDRCIAEGKFAVGQQWEGRATNIAKELDIARAIEKEQEIRRKQAEIRDPNELAEKIIAKLPGICRISPNMAMKVLETLAQSLGRELVQPLQDNPLPEAEEEQPNEHERPGEPDKSI